MKSFLTASGVAKLEKVNRSTVMRWIKKGLLGEIKRVGTNGNYRISLTNYETFKKENKL